jgi:hypothetical protein
MGLYGVLATAGLLALLSIGTEQGSSSSVFSAQKQKQVQIVTMRIGSSADVQKLAAAGFDIAGVDLANNQVDVVLSEAQKSVVASMLPDAEVVITKDISTDIAPHQDYTTPDELRAFLDNIAAQYPGITPLEVIGRSVENREIVAIKISDNPAERELDEPTVLFNAMHHAREVMTVEVAMDTIQQLTAGYGTDERITNWVDTTEIWVLPMVNPDGNNKVWTEYSMWRKNTQGGYGVDINRNYPYAWGSCNGSSGSRNSDTYRGPSAGSEPETQTLMNLVARVQPVFNISYHSYSEMVLYPFGCQGQRTATQEVVEGIGRQMAAALPSDSGRGTYEPGTPWEILYSVDGGDVDWMYNAHHVIPYVIEVSASSQGFQPDYRWRQPTVEKLRTAWTMLLDRVHQGGVRGIVQDGSGRVRPNATITFERTAPSTTTAVTFGVKEDGTYHLVLQPGTYNLVFTEGQETVTREVTVGTGLVVENIEF